MCLYSFARYTLLKVLLDWRISGSKIELILLVHFPTYTHAIQVKDEVQSVA